MLNPMTPQAAASSRSASEFRQIVLLGVGHTNSHVLRMWRTHAIPGVRLVCVSNYGTATYSGMLPGVLAGQYAPSQMTIDLERLARAAGARLVVGTVERVDRERRALHVTGEEPIAYDWLSVGIGSQPRLDAIVEGSAVVPIKPMQTLLERLDRRLADLSAAARAAPNCRSVAYPVKVVVVGSGAGGVEVALCLPALLDRRCGSNAWQMTLVGASARLPAGAAAATARFVAREFSRRGVCVVAGRRVTRVDGGRIELDDGRELFADLVLWATDAAAPPLLRQLGLPTDERGFLCVRPTLQTEGDERIFAVGDTAAWAEPGLPKAGVYAVREGPVLWDNLNRAARGEPLRDYVPQTRFLKLLNLGDGRAIGEYAGLAFRGRWVWRWKDRIDRGFLRLFETTTDD